jgi:hypothetical protein
MESVWAVLTACFHLIDGKLILKLNHDGLLSGRSFPCAFSCVLLHLTLFYYSFFTSLVHD